MTGGCLLPTMVPPFPPDSSLLTAHLLPAISLPYYSLSSCTFRDASLNYTAKANSQNVSYPLPARHDLLGLLSSPACWVTLCPDGPPRSFERCPAAVPAFHLLITVAATSAACPTAKALPRQRTILHALCTGVSVEGKGEGQQNKNNVLQTPFIQKKRGWNVWVPPPGWDKGCEGSSAVVPAQEGSAAWCCGDMLALRSGNDQAGEDIQRAPWEVPAPLPFPSYAPCLAGGQPCRQPPMPQPQPRELCSGQGGLEDEPEWGCHFLALCHISPGKPLSNYAMASHKVPFSEGSCKEMYQRTHHSKGVSGGVEDSVQNCYLILIS